MASSIKENLPIDADATPQAETRRNFARAKSEIEALQDATAIPFTGVELLADADAGAISVSVKYSIIDLTGADNVAFTLADGSVGQEKVIKLRSKGDAGNAVVTPATLEDTGTAITLDAAGEAVTLVWASASGWTVVDGIAAA